MDRSSPLTAGAGSVGYGYDTANRLTSVSRGGSNFAYSYDTAGRLHTRSYPDGTQTTLAYDADSRLASVASAGKTTSYTYDAADELTATTLPNGYTEQRSYDNAGRLTDIRSVKGGSTIAAATYTLDPVGNPTQIGRDGQTENYSYDAADRVTAACYGASVAGCPAGSLISYGYDRVGNRQSESRFGVQTSSSYDAADQLTHTVTGGTTTSYGYDAAGNETQAGSRSFSYDLANHVTQITDTSGTLASFSYDGNGNRLTKTAAGVTTSYAWDESNDLPQLALEQQAGTTLRSYLNGLDLISMTTPAGTFYYQHDSLGSTAAITDQAGQLEWTYNYDPYGRNRTTTKADPNAPANLRQFTGELFDPEAGLYDLRARLYDPVSGRRSAYRKTLRHLRAAR